MDCQLRGTLQDIPASQFFHLIALTRKTGTYHLYQRIRIGRRGARAESVVPEVAAGEERVSISFDQGMLVYATTNGPESHLASILYKAGKLNEQRHRMFRQRAGTGGDKALALAMINANCLTQTDIVQCVQRHILEIVYDVIAWDQESFRFVEGELPPDDAITVWVNPDNVIAEGKRRVREFNELLRTVPNLDAILKFPEVPRERVKTLELRAAEWRVLSLVNSKDSIRDIAGECHMTDSEIRRIVASLLRSQLVEMISTGKRTADANVANNKKSVFGGAKAIVPSQASKQDPWQGGFTVSNGNWVERVQ